MRLFVLEAYWREFDAWVQPFPRKHLTERSRESMVDRGLAEKRDHPDVMFRIVDRDSGEVVWGTLGTTTGKSRCDDR